MFNERISHTWSNMALEIVDLTIKKNCDFPVRCIVYSPGQMMRIGLTHPPDMIKWHLTKLDDLDYMCMALPERSHSCKLYTRVCKLHWIKRYASVYFIYIYILPLCMDKNTKVCVSHCFPPHNFRRAKLKMDSMEVKLFAGSQSELVDIACAFRSFTEVHSPAQ